MRIVVISGLAYSLVNFRFDFLKELISQGHEVTAIAPMQSSGLSPGQDEIQYVRNILQELGIRLIIVNFDRSGTSIFSEILVIFRISNVLRSLKPHCVVSYTIKAVVVGILAANLCGIKKKIACLTGLGALFSDQSNITPIKRWLALKALKITLALSNKVVVLNQENHRTLIQKRLVVREKLIVRYDGVDLNRFLYEEKKYNDKVKILFIGRLLIDKGIREYVTAAKNILNTRDDCIFQIIGPFDENPACVNKSELESWLLSDKIEYLGPQANVHPYLVACDIFCLPSYHEGLPRTVLEAMSVGRPIVTTTAPGCIDTIENGISGILVPPRDIQSLQNAIVSLVDNRDLRLKYGFEANRRAQEEFDSKVAAKKMCELIASI